MTEPDDLILYTVYCRPTDFPGEFVVRRCAAKIDGPEMDPELFARGASLDEVRLALPPGLFRLPPDIQDDPVIVEVWL